MTEIPIPNGLLREIRESDLPRLIELSKDKEVMNHFFMIQDENLIGYCWERILARRDKFHSINGNKNLNHSLAIEADGLIRGYLSLVGYEIVRKIPNIGFDLSYFVGREYRDKGVATDSVKSTIAYAFDTLDAERIYSTVNAENLFSIKVLKKAGFKQLPRSCTMRSVIDCRTGLLFEIGYSDFNRGAK
jgi:RimJ/RimL family protein N-acetyltransferase